jgi:hypothetical protein
MSKLFSTVGTLTLDSELTFGKYEGCTVYDALSADPTYIAWLYVEAGKSFKEEVKKVLVTRLLELCNDKKLSKTKHKNYEPWNPDDVPY